MGGTVTSLYDILKARKTGLPPDLYTKLRAQREMSERVITAEPPIYFKSDGTPLSEYQINGDTVQSGTPTPDNPVEVLGVGDRTANLFDYNAYFNSVFTSYGDYFNYSPIQLLPNTTYTLSTSIVEYRTSPRQTAFIVATTNQEPKTVDGGISNISPITITTESDGILKLYKRISPNVSPITPTKDKFDNGDWLMLNEGSTTIPYEPHGYKIPITLNSVTQNVYLDEPLYSGDYIKRNADGTGVLHQSGVDTPIITPQLTSIKGTNELNVDTQVTPEIALKGKIKQLPDSDMNALLSVMEEM